MKILVTEYKAIIKDGEVVNTLEVITSRKEDLMVIAKRQKTFAERLKKAAQYCHDENQSEMAIKKRLFKREGETFVLTVKTITE